ADGQAVAAVVAARRFHVEHLVDPNDLRLDRLGDARLDNRGGGAGKGGRNYGLRRYDVRELRDRNPRQRQEAGDRDDDGDDNRQPRPIDENRRDHSVAFGSLEDGPLAPRPATSGAIVGGGLAGPGDTGWSGRIRCSPSLITSSPSLSPLLTTAVDGVDWPSWIGRRCALFCASTT